MDRRVAACACTLKGNGARARCAIKLPKSVPSWNEARSSKGAARVSPAARKLSSTQRKKTCSCVAISCLLQKTRGRGSKSKRESERRVVFAWRWQEKTEAQNYGWLGCVWRAEPNLASLAWGIHQQSISTMCCLMHAIYYLQALPLRADGMMTLYNVASEFVGVGSWAAALACASSTARTASSAARSNAVAPPRSRIVVSAFASSNTRTQSACRYLTARCKAVRPRRFRALSWAYSASSDWMIPAWPCFAACQGCCRTHDINNRPPTSRVPPRQARRTRTLCSGVLRRRS